MFSLIITIIAIALVAAIALATLYYGGVAFNKSSAEAKAVQIQNEGQQIINAIQLYRLDHNSALPTKEQLLAPDAQGKTYLKAWPGTNLMQGSADTGASFAFADAGIWTLIDGEIGAKYTEPVTEDVCRSVNKIARGDDGIMSKLSTSYSTQCFHSETSSFTVVILQNMSEAGLSKVEGSGSVITTGAPVSNSQDPLWFVPPGSKVPRGNLSFSGSFDFTGTSPGTPYVQTITVTNIGQGSSQITGMNFLNYASNFTINQTCQNQLLPGDTCEIQVSYLSDIELVGGTYLNVSASGTASKTYKVQTSIETSLPHPVASLDTSVNSIDFGSVGLDQLSTEKTVHLSASAGGTPVIISDISVSNSNTDAEYTLTTNCKIGQAIDATKGCDVTATFKSPVANDYTASIVVTSDASNPTVTIPVTAKAINTTPVTNSVNGIQITQVKEFTTDNESTSASDLVNRVLYNADASNYYFDSNSIYKKEDSRHYSNTVSYMARISNAGPSSETIDVTSSVNTNVYGAAYFDPVLWGISEPACDVTLASGQSCWVFVHGSMSSEQFASLQKTTLLTINHVPSNGTDYSTPVFLTTYDQGLAVLASSVDGVHFGDVNKSTSVTRSFLVYPLTNAPIPISISSIAVNDQTNSGYSIASDCVLNQPLAPSGCTVTVTINSSKLGGALGMVNISSNAVNSALNVELFANITGTPDTPPPGPVEKLEVIGFIVPEFGNLSAVNTVVSGVDYSVVDAIPEYSWFDSDLNQTTVYAQGYIVLKNTGPSVQTLYNNQDSDNTGWETSFEDTTSFGYPTCGTEIVSQQACIVRLSSSMVTELPYTGHANIEHAASTEQAHGTLTLSVPGYFQDELSGLVADVISINNGSADPVNQGQVVDVVYDIYGWNDAFTYTNVSVGGFSTFGPRDTTYTVDASNCEGVEVSSTTHCQVTIHYTLGSYYLGYTQDFVQYFAQFTLAFKGTSVQDGKLYSSGGGADAIIYMNNPGGNVTINPKILNLGEFPVGTGYLATTQYLDVGAINEDMIITDVTLTGDADFNAPSTNCLDATVVSSSSCFISINGSPTSVGIKNATITVTATTLDGTPVAPVTSQISMTGISNVPAITKIDLRLIDVVDTAGDQIGFVSNTDSMFYRVRTEGGAREVGPYVNMKYKVLNNTVAPVSIAPTVTPAYSGSRLSIGGYSVYGLDASPDGSDWCGDTIAPNSSCWIGLINYNSDWRDQNHDFVTATVNIVGTSGSLSGTFTIDQIKNTAYASSGGLVLDTSLLEVSGTRGQGVDTYALKLYNTNTSATVSNINLVVDSTQPGFSASLSCPSAANTLSPMSYDYCTVTYRVDRALYPANHYDFVGVTLSGTTEGSNVSNDTHVSGHLIYDLYDSGLPVLSVGSPTVVSKNAGDTSDSIAQFTIQNIGGGTLTNVNATTDLMAYFSSTAGNSYGSKALAPSDSDLTINCTGPLVSTTDNSSYCIAQLTIHNDKFQGFTINEKHSFVVNVTANDASDSTPYTGGGWMGVEYHAQVPTLAFKRPNNVNWESGSWANQYANELWMETLWNKQGTRHDWTYSGTYTIKATGGTAGSTMAIDSSQPFKFVDYYNGGPVRYYHPTESSYQTGSNPYVDGGNVATLSNYAKIDMKCFTEQGVTTTSTATLRTDSSDYCEIKFGFYVPRNDADPDATPNVLWALKNNTDYWLTQQLKVYPQFKANSPVATYKYLSSGQLSAPDNARADVPLAYRGDGSPLTICGEIYFGSSTNPYTHRPISELIREPNNVTSLPSAPYRDYAVIGSAETQEVNVRDSLGNLCYSRPAQMYGETFVQPIATLVVVKAFSKYNDFVYACRNFTYNPIDLNKHVYFRMDYGYLAYASSQVVSVNDHPCPQALFGYNAETHFVGLGEAKTPMGAYVSELHILY